MHFFAANFRLFQRRFFTANPRLIENLIFISLALFYAIYAVKHAQPNLFGDEWRYLYYADNLINGFYSPSDRVFLWNGPLYPMLLVPLKYFELPKAVGVAANGLFYALALKLLYHTLSRSCRKRIALITVAFFAFYLPIYDYFHLLYTEALSFLLVSLWIYSLRSAFATRSLTWWLTSSLSLASLALCKISYGYVTLGFMLTSFALSVLAFDKVFWLRSALHALFALVLCSPFLVYNYQLTGRVFYWGSPGEMSLYWLSTPYPEEKGEWFHQGHVNGNPTLKSHHKEFFDRLSGLDRDPNLPVMEQVFNLSTPESADFFMKAAIENIKNHPLKFFQNCLANVARLWLDWPYSFHNSWNLSNRVLLFNSFVLFLVFCSLIKVCRGLVTLTPEIVALSIFFFLAFIGSSLVSALGRLMIPNIPLIFVISMLCLEKKRVGNID